MNGTFIVFEGIDGAGKTTICNRVLKVLLSRGINAIVTSEPTNGVIGKFIRSGSTKEVSQKTEALLFCADRNDHTEKIKQWISDGKVVLCDRYFASTLAYQSSSLDGNSIDKDWLININNDFIEIPNLSILLDISPAQSIRRLHCRGNMLSKFENPDLLECIRANYLKIAEYYGFKIIDASDSEDQILSKVIDIISKVI